MNWTEVLQAGRNRIVIVSVLSVVAGMLLAYALGITWSMIGWSLLGATGIVVLAAVGQMLYVIVSVERGYRANAPVGGQTSAKAQPRVLPQGLPVATRIAMPKAHSAQFDEAVADLRAAQYLLSKVQSSGAFPEFSEPQKRECDHALEEVRALLREVSRDTVVQRFAS
jgi:hypothetical protein